MLRSFFKFFINGYEVTLDKRRILGSSFASVEVSGKLAQGKRDGVMLRMLKQSESASSFIAATGTKTYGAAFMSFGLLTLLSYFLKEYLGEEGYSAVFTLTVGIICAVLSIPCLLLDKPMTLALQDNPLSDLVLFEFFCIKRSRPDKNAHGVPAIVGIVIGAVMAVAGYFWPIEYVCLSAVMLLYLMLAFLSPEFSYLLSILSLPYLSLVPRAEILLSFMILVTAFSLFRKVIYGKRALFFEQYDIYISLLVLMILSSGIFIKGFESFGSSVFMLIASLGYVVSGNIIINRRLSDLALNAFAVSTVPAAIVSIYQFALLAACGRVGEIIGNGISSTFASTDAMAVYLSVSLMFLLALIRQAKGATRALYIAVFVLDLAALVLTSELFCVFAVLLGIAVYFASRSRVLSLCVILLLFALPYGVLLLPAEIIDPVLAYVPGINSIGELKSLWESALRAFSDNLMLGIGIGPESFAEEMAGYGVFGVSNSSNTFIELGLEAGVLALVFFLVLLGIRLRHRASYFGYIRTSSVAKQSPLIAAATFVLVTVGAYSYIWEYLPYFYLFWCVFGIGSATLRIAKKENDDKVLYYDDTRTPDRSEIDLEIG